MSAYFPTSSLIREGILVLYDEPWRSFFLLKLSSSALTADASAAVTFPVALTNRGKLVQEPLEAFLSLLTLVKYERKSLVS